MFIVDVRSRIDMFSGSILLFVKLQTKHLVTQKGGAIVFGLCLGVLDLGGSDATRGDCG